MKDWLDNDFDVEVDPKAPVYVISVVSELLNIPVWTLRRLDDSGVVRAQRIGKSTRCYSYIQVKKLNYVKYLMEYKKVNISGIKVILNIKENVADSGNKSSTSKTREANKSL